MKKLLEQFFGCTVNVEEYKEHLSLPIYMTLRQMQTVEIYGVSFVLVDIKKETELSASAMKKQQKLYEDAIKCPVAYEISVDSTATRNSLVNKGIPFISLPGNVFLPFLGIILQEKYKKQIGKTDQMMPVTQMVFLELLYMKDGERVSKSNVARRLNLTKTSITRATVQLNEMKLIVEDKVGTEICIMRNHPRKEYYSMAKEYLINPVQKVITVKRDELTDEVIQAGETALSLTTELNPPLIEEVSIYKGAEIVDQLVNVDVRFEENNKCAKLQLWKYDPSYFSRNGVVDPVSLICTFKNCDDERIEKCIEELLEEL